MNTKVLTIGDKAIVRKRSKIDKNEYTTQIQDINGKDIRILTPMYRSALIRLRPDTRIEVLVFGASKVFEFDAQVKETASDGNLNYTDIVLTSSIKKIERRNYFRVKITKDICVREKNEKNPNDFVSAITIDLSGGGVQFSTSHKFTEGINLEIKMEIDGKEILVNGELLNKSWQDGLGIYKYSVEFLDLSDLIQEMIIKYVFKIQREKLSKR